jgi:hypothetical protein
VGALDGLLHDALITTAAIPPRWCARLRSERCWPISCCVPAEVIDATEPNALASCT